MKKTIEVKLFSFDVYDTLLTRLVGEPKSLFLLLGQALSLKQILLRSAETFAALRIQSEELARKNQGDHEVTLDQIYHELQFQLSLSDSTRDAMKNEELVLEKQFARPMPGMVQRLQKSRERGSRIAFLSDTYLPSVFIRALLMEHSLLVGDEKCYISCEQKATKCRGDLYLKVIQFEGIQRAEMRHCGSHLISDEYVPGKLGLQVEPVTGPRLNKYEKLLESYKFETNGLSSLMTAASRMARLEISCDSEREAAIRDVSAGVAAPLLIGYVLWVLREAKSRGIQRLYFISRDGKILLKIAEILCPAMGIEDLELRYLYGGRQAWHLPSIFEIGEHEISWLFDSESGLSLKSLLGRLTIDRDEVDQVFLSNLGFSLSEWAKEFTETQKKVLKESFLRGDWNDLVFSKAKGQREKLLKYLEQEKVLRLEKWGMVDIGWVGRIQHSLGKILKSIHANVPTGFYLGLTSTSYRDDYGEKLTYMFDGRAKVGFNDWAFNNWTSWAEVFTSADHGTVMGYQIQDAKVQPVLKEVTDKAVMDWGHTKMVSTILSVTHYFAEGLQLRSQDSAYLTLRRSVLEQILFFLKNAQDAEVTAWGSFPRAADQTSDHYRYAAEPITVFEMIKCLMGQSLITQKYSYHNWPYGCYKLSSPISKILFRIKHRLDSVFNPL